MYIFLKLQRDSPNFRSRTPRSAKHWKICFQIPPKSKASKENLHSVYYGIKLIGGLKKWGRKSRNTGFKAEQPNFFIVLIAIKISLIKGTVVKKKSRSGTRSDRKDNVFFRENCFLRSCWQRCHSICVVVDNAITVFA